MLEKLPKKFNLLLVFLFILLGCQIQEQGASKVPLDLPVEDKNQNDVLNDGSDDFDIGAERILIRGEGFNLPNDGSLLIKDSHTQEYFKDSKNQNIELKITKDEKFVWDLPIRIIESQHPIIVDFFPKEQNEKQVIESEKPYGSFVIPYKEISSESKTIEVEVVISTISTLLAKKVMQQPDIDVSDHELQLAEQLDLSEKLPDDPRVSIKAVQIEYGLVWNMELLQNLSDNSLDRETILDNLANSDQKLMHFDEEENWSFTEDGLKLMSQNEELTTAQITYGTIFNDSIQPSLVSLVKEVVWIENLTNKGSDIISEEGRGNKAKLVIESGFENLNKTAEKLEPIWKDANDEEKTSFKVITNTFIKPTNDTINEILSIPSEELSDISSTIIEIRTDQYTIRDEELDERLQLVDEELKSNGSVNYDMLKDDSLSDEEIDQLTETLITNVESALLKTHSSIYQLNRKILNVITWKDLEENFDEIGGGQYVTKKNYLKMLKHISELTLDQLRIYVITNQDTLNQFNDNNDEINQMWEDIGSVFGEFVVEILSEMTNYLVTNHSQIFTEMVNNQDIILSSVDFELIIDSLFQKIRIEQVNLTVEKIQYLQNIIDDLFMRVNDSEVEITFYSAEGFLKLMEQRLLEEIKAIQSTQTE